MPLSTTRIFLALAAFVVAPVLNAAEPMRSETRVGLSDAEFKAANSQLAAQGMRLVDITVAEVQGKPVIGALWWWNEGMTAGSAERARQLQERVFLKQSEQDVRALIQKLGTAPEVLDSYGVGGKTWFAVAFPPAGEAPLQAVGTFLTVEQTGEMRGEAQANGFDLVRVDAYVDAGAVHFLPVFNRRPAADIDIVPESTPLSLAAHAGEWALAGKSPMSITLHEGKPGDRGTLIYVTTVDAVPGRELRTLLSAEDFRRDVAPRLAAGGQIVDLDSYAYEEGVRYAAVLVPAPKKVDTDSYKTMGSELEKIIKKK